MPHPTLLMEHPWHTARYTLSLSQLLDEVIKLSRQRLTLLLAAFLVLSLADLILTKMLLEQSGGAIYEANPLADLIIQQLGWGALTFFKLGMVGMVASIIIYIACHQPATARKLVSFACVLMSGVVGYSTYLVCSFT